MASPMTVLRRLAGPAAALAAVVLLGFAARQAFLGLLWRGTIDYGARPPATVFAAVTGRPVPAGMTNLRVAGRSSPLGLKHWVWMSFDLTEADAAELASGRIPLEGADAAKYIGQDWADGNPFEAEDKPAVLWHEVEAITKPEVFMVAWGKPGSAFVWAGVLVIDRTKRRGYLHAGGD
jgi:hypothetical protein